MAEEKKEHDNKMKKMEAEMEQVFEMKVKEKKQKLKDSEGDVSSQYTFRVKYYLPLKNGVVRGLIDIVVVLPMSAMYAGAHRFDPELRQYASRVPCRLTLVYKMSPPLNLASLDITCAEWNRQ